MQKLLQFVQGVAACVVVVAGVPLAINEFRRLGEANDARARAAGAAARAEAAIQGEDNALAARLYTEAVTNAPDRAEYRLGLATAQAKQILENEEIVDARNVLRLQASIEDAVKSGAATDTQLMALGRLHSFRGQRDVARRLFEQVLSTQPKNARALMYLGDLEFKADELDNAQTTLRRAVEADPTLTLAKFALGQVYATRNAWSDALPWLEMASRELPRNAQAALAYGRALAASEQWAEATKALERALTLDPRLVAAYGPLGDAYVSQQRVEAAIASYRQAWEKNRDLTSLKKLGRIYVQLGAIEAATTLFNQVRDLAPNEPEPYMVLGGAANAAGQGDAARAAWTKCVQLAAGHEEWASVGQKCQQFLSQPAPKGAPPPSARRGPR